MSRLHRLLATLALLVAATAVCAAPALARKHDRDKLPDRWERKFHLNLKKNDANRDKDRDGLSNYGEYRSHTNPRKKDSDHDGRRDGREDYDRDKLQNRDEIRLGFDPGDKDSDNDRIKDGKENAGKITAVTGSSITIHLAAKRGRGLTAGLGDDLAVACRTTSGSDSSGGADTGDDPSDAPGEDSESDDAGDGPDDDADTSTDEPDNDVGASVSTFGGILASAAQDDPDGDAPDDPDETDDPSEDGDDPSEADFDKQFDAEFADGTVCDASSLKKGALVHEATVDRSGPTPVVTAIKLVR